MTGELLDGRYRLREQLGAGAFGTVYRADHEVLGRRLRTVAVKVFHDRAAGAARRSMLAEALRITELVERCDDPVVRDRFLTCLDAGETPDGGRPYLVTEFAPAGDLARHVAGAQLPAEAAAELLREIAEGVAHLHREGVLHLDLKPANIVVAGVARRLRIADYGAATRIAELADAEPPQGTLVYQAPEVLERRRPGTTADVYALGLIAYELLTGRLPDHELLEAHAGRGDLGALVALKRRPVTPPSLVNAGVDGHPLEQVVLRALDPSPAARIADGGALLAALDPAGSPPAGRDAVGDHGDGLARLRVALERRADAAVLRPLTIGLAEGPVDDPEYHPVVAEALVRLGEIDHARRVASAGIAAASGPPAWRAMAAAYAGTDLGRAFERRLREESA